VFGKIARYWNEFLYAAAYRLGLSGSVESFWNKCHKNKELLYLSGCNYEETVNFLRVADKVKRGTAVLEIGVGMGYVTRGLYDLGAIVDALDISPVALERVSGYCRKTYHVFEVNKLTDNSYDLVICHNVVQHVPTVDLKAELIEVIRALKPTGVFAIEFVSSDNANDAGANPRQQDITAGALCRTPEFMMNLVTESGGRSEIVFSAKVENPVVKSVHILHVFRELKTI